MRIILVTMIVANAIGLLAPFATVRTAASEGGALGVFPAVNSEAQAATPAPALTNIASWNDSPCLSQVTPKW